MDAMEEDEVIDEVLEIERSMQMDLEEENRANNIHGQIMVGVEVIQHGDGLGQDGQMVVIGNDHYQIVENNDPVAPDIGVEEIAENQSEASAQTSPPDGQDSSEDGGENGIDVEGSNKNVTIVVQLTDEGAITVNEGNVVPEGVESHVYFPITLPSTKVKSVENPLVGAKQFQVQRSRKTKPQAILYNDEIDQVYEMLPDGTPSTIPAQPTFHQEISSSPERDPAALGELTSTLIPSNIELEIVENFLAQQSGALGPEGFYMLPATDPPANREVPHMDHSYCTSVPVFGPNNTEGGVAAGAPVINRKTVITVVSDAGKRNVPQQPIIPIVYPIPSDLITKARGLKKTPLQPTPQVTEWTRNSTTETAACIPVSPEGSSSIDNISSSEARARRSQRQQDRNERQEAERIMAENQQMLQREKKIYGNKGPSSPAIVNIPPIPTEFQSGSKATAGGTTMSEATPGDSAIPEKTLVTTAEEDESNSKRPYPKRQNRKLPAHLADPNYVNLDESERKFQEEAGITSVLKKKKAEDEDDELVIVENDDDPNRLWCICRKPHNNRFMICCDICEEWFHGKCVGITKAASSKFDKWVCPACKKERGEKEKIPAKVAARGSRDSAGSKNGGTRNRNVSGQTPGSAKSSSRTPKSKLGGKDVNGKGSRELGAQLRQTETPQQAPAATASNTTPTTTEKCIICKKSSRKDSVYCSDECVIKHSHETGSSPSTNATATSTPQPAGNKLKRSNSRITDKKGSEDFLMFHVLSSGSSKSTAIVPPKHKDSGSPLGKQEIKSPQKAANTPQTTTAGTPVTKVLSSSTSGKRSIDSSGGAAVKRAKLVEQSSKRSVRASTSSNTKSSSATSSSRSAHSSIENKHARSRLTSEGKDSPTKSRSKDDKQKKEKEPEKPKEPTEAEILSLRQTSRTSLTTTFQTRLKDLTEAELAEIPEENTPESLSLEIENELFNTFSGVNAKYRAKFRSILFNLKDAKNNLFKTVAMNELKPRELVKLESSQLASDELAQWRLNESKKELEMIKRSEIAKFEELKKQEKIDAELGFEQISTVIVENEVRSLGNNAATVDDKVETGLVTVPPESKAITRSSARHKSSQHSHSKSDKSAGAKSSSDKNKHDGKKSDSKHYRSTRSSEASRHDEKSRHGSSSTKKTGSRSSPKDKQESFKEKDTPRFLRSRGRDHHPSSSSHKDSKESSRTAKAKDDKKDRKTGDKEKEFKTNADSSEEASRGAKGTKSSERSKTKEVSETSGANDENSGSSTIFSTDDSNSPPAVSEDVPADITAIYAKSGVRPSIDSTSTDPELPSSTIKTPDFTSDDTTGSANAEKGSPEEQKPVMKSKFVMPELGSFNASLYNVSHNSLSGTYFPESPVPIVGRIIPTTVWDYIDKMKKSKEVIVLRLAPSTPADAEGYMSFFTYFSSRSRLAVLGGIISPIKDVYLVPLEKHTPINKALLPLNGPGLPKNRSHCLLAVITRHSNELNTTKKRKVSGSEMITKRMKLSTEIKPGLISALNINSPRDKKGISVQSGTPKKSPDDTSEETPATDDDLPYTPWEEEDSTTGAAGPNTPAVVMSDPKILKDLQELDAKIQEEQQAIMRMQMKSTKGLDSVIPGLDGEFGGEPDPTAGDIVVPSFLRSPTVPQVVASPPKLTPLATLPLTAISEATDVAGSSPDSIQEQDSAVEDEAPYSPSQLELDEDEESF